MKEHNKKTLIEALSSLQEHEPPEELWMGIEEELEQHDQIVPPELLKTLPMYEPPPSVWDGIAGELIPQRPAKVVRLGWQRVLSVAASVALVLVAYWQLQPEKALQPENVSVSFSEETVDPALLARDWQEDEDAFREYLAICEAKKFICEQPEFKKLQDELEELTLAKDELDEVIGAYGAAPELISQIKEIELERTDILKKMMVMLI